MRFLNTDLMKSKVWLIIMPISCKDFLILKVYIRKPIPTKQMLTKRTSSYI